MKSNHPSFCVHVDLYGACKFDNKKTLKLWKLMIAASFQGHLSGYGIEEQLPTIAVVAHYDSFGIAPVCQFYN